MKYDTTNECAFPCHQPEEIGIREGYFSGGMTLRAYFAGQALGAMPLESGDHFDYSDWNNDRPQSHAKRVAKMCRIYADALIEELNR